MAERTEIANLWENTAELVAQLNRIDSQLECLTSEMSRWRENGGSTRARAATQILAALLGHLHPSDDREEWVVEKAVRLADLLCERLSRVDPA